MIRWRALPALLAAPAWGCLSVPERTAECDVTADCDSAHGEVCEEGVCWGNPPVGTFAAVILPPSERDELAPREVASIPIELDGWMPDLQLETPVKFSGRIEEACDPLVLCTHASIAATITITRPSRFYGGPGFKRVVISQPDADGTSFEVALPRPDGSDASYELTIVPEGRGATPTMGTTAAQAVPPLRMTLSAASNVTSKTIGLGGVDLPTVDGMIANGGNGLANYRVVALGRWTPGAPRTEVSTVAYTDGTGTYHLVLSSGLVDDVEIVAKPFGTALLPTLHLTDVPATTSSAGRNLALPAGIGSATTLTLPVTGTDAGGQIDPVAGARATLTATIATGPNAFATFSAEATTDSGGIASLPVLDGPAINAAYRLAIVPPASSSLGVVFDQPVTYALEQAPLLLPERVVIRGVVRAVNGEPLEDVSVTARPSLRFLWSLDATQQAFLSAIPAATAVSDNRGGFVLPVDAMIAQTWGHYDLVFEPAVTARAPTWVVSEIAIPGATSAPTVEVADVTLPDAAFVHGAITDPFGSVVEGAEVKVFQALSEARSPLCDEVPNSPDSCPVPAPLHGRGVADAQGIVRLTLPR